MSHASHQDRAKSPLGYKGKEQPAHVADDLHHPHQSAQGLPPPQHLQHPRSSVVQQQQHQHHPDSPHQQAHPAAQGPYASPHSSTHSLPTQHQSPYVANLPGQSAQQGPEVPYYTAHPSPYSANSATGSYSSAEIEPMAAATMNRPYPPIYGTPQSNSPASVQSPQHDQHGRPLYSQPSAQLQQNMYYQPYQMAQQSPYAQHPVSQQHQPMSSTSLLMSNPHGQSLQHPPPNPHTPGLGSPRTKQLQQPLQRPPSGLGPTQGPPTGPPGAPANMHHGPPSAANVNPNAAPGPIPATTPLVVRQDQNGVQWIAFEYSRDRVKMEYTIRCDVESVNVEDLPQEFKTENCVYPRACCSKEQYKGNRLHYETECNTVGWALAQLNPCLRGKRGLIQRAVDSWRNSNQDPRLRSRRVRRMAKISNRKNMAAQQGTHMTGPSGPASAGVPNSAGLNPGPGPRQPAMSIGGPQLHHHHEHPGGGPPGGNDDVSAGSNYNDGPHTHHHQAPNGQTSSPNDVRHAQNFYPTYPTAQNVGNSSVLSIHDGMGHLGPHSVPHSNSIPQSTQEDKDDQSKSLFGDLPESKRRKFILVDDSQRGTRVRVRVMLDQVHMEEMPDSYRKSNSVFPRSYFPMQMQSPPSSPRGRAFFKDDPVAEASNALSTDAPLTGRMLVKVKTLDGDAEVPLPRRTKTKRSKEVTLNDLGYRMSWAQSRVFSNRALFLQRSLDAYRNKMRSTMVAAGQDVASVAPHFETRVGKRRWLERGKKPKREFSP